jgi:thiosulfate/3-mercaptopyruvate sulfurtransferase
MTAQPMAHSNFQTLISASNLLQHSNDSDWIVIDCRHDLADPAAGRAAYGSGHIPGAMFGHLDDDLAGAKLDAGGHFRGRHPLPEIAELIETLRRLGVNQNSQVIAYDAHGGMFAARLWWMLRWVGHARVAVLDGGLSAWSAAGGTLSTDLSAARRGDIGATAPLATTVSADQLVANLTAGGLTVVDARAPDRYRGENETLDPVGGHIPGAKNRCFRDNLQADGRFKPAAQLRAEFNSVIATPHDSVMQCGSGVTACHNLLALEVAGMHGAALYPGSWSEWCSDGSRPVANEAAG